VVGIRFVETQWVLIAVGSLAVLFLIGAIEFHWIPEVTHGSRIRDYGLVASAAGFVTVVSLFFPQKDVIIAALLTVGLADPLASAVGRHLGRHMVTAWGSRRSLEGSIAFASVTFAVSLGFFYVSSQVTPREIGLSVFVACTAAAVELIVPSALDNLVIPVWVAFLFSLSKASGSQLPLSWPIAVLVSAVSAPLIYRLKWIDLPGTAASMLVTAVAIALGGWGWLLPIAVFFSSGSLLTRFKQTERSAKKPRNIQQAVVNGIIPILPLLGHAIDGKPVWYVLYVGAVAVANADTWSTEIGRLSRTMPISLRTLRPVPVGTSGAISPVGTLASVLGGILIGGVAAVIGPPGWRLYLLLTGALVGPIGAFIDSILGAWAQCRYRCNACYEICEEANHCGVSGQRFSGLRGVNNDTVNAMANVVGMFFSLTLYGIIR
jgi:uncharacterized protein (TIGR00297 family)